MHLLNEPSGFTFVSIIVVDIRCCLEKDPQVMVFKLVRQLKVGTGDARAVG